MNSNPAQHRRASPARTRRKESMTKNKSAKKEIKDTSSNSHSIDKELKLKQKYNVSSGSSYRSPAPTKMEDKPRHASSESPSTFATGESNMHHVSYHTFRDNDTTQSEFGGGKVHVDGGGFSEGQYMEEKYAPSLMSSRPKNEVESVANSKNVSGPHNLPLPPLEKIAPHGVSKHHKQEKKHILPSMFKTNSTIPSKTTKVSDINGSNYTSSSSEVNGLLIRDVPKSISIRTQAASHTPGSPRLSSRHPMNNSPLTTQRESSVLFPEAGGRVGISNLGNTCFMNSMLQCLGQTGEMTRLFLKTPPRGKKLVQAYSDLMREMWEGSSYTSVTFSRPLYPVKLKECFSRMHPQFSGYSQHDAQEFMRFLVSGLHEELKEKCEQRLDPPEKEDPGLWYQWYMKIEDSALAKVFVGQVRSSLKCERCNIESNTFDPFWELSVSIPRKKASRSPVLSSYKPRYYSGYSSYSPITTQPITAPILPTHLSPLYLSPLPVHLEECLAQFTSTEDLHGDESPYCMHCESLQTCSKRMTIERVPRVLVIHLKRFSSYNSKLKTPVIIPHTLDLAKYVTNSRGHSYIYELYAVTHHSGNVHFGHYTAWCKHYTTGKWYTYSDSSVTQRPLPSVLGSDRDFSSDTAYVLFYRQRDTHRVQKILTSRV